MPEFHSAVFGRNARQTAVEHGADCNVDGVSAYLGGALYYHRISEVTAKDYEGFVFEKAHRADDA